MFEKLTSVNRKKIRDALILKDSRVLEILKQVQISKTFENVVLVDMAIDLADELHIKPEEALGIILSLTNVINKRTIVCKPSHFRDILTLMPYYNYRHNKYMVRTVIHHKLKDNIVTDMHKMGTDTHLSKKGITKDLSNKISEEKRIDKLLAIVFGFKK